MKIPQRLGNLDARPEDGGGEPDARQHNLNLAKHRHGQQTGLGVDLVPLAPLLVPPFQVWTGLDG